jgi:hypothetical protein
LESRVSDLELRLTVGLVEPVRVGFAMVGDLDPSPVAAPRKKYKPQRAYPGD